MKLKIIISFCLIFCILFSFSSCKQKNPNNTTEQLTEEESSSQPTPSGYSYSSWIEKTDTNEKIIITYSKNNETLWTYAEDNISTIPYQSHNILMYDSTGVYVWMNNKIVFITNTGTLGWETEAKSFIEYSIADDSYIYCVFLNENLSIDKYAKDTGLFIENRIIESTTILYEPFELSFYNKNQLLITDALNTNLLFSLENFTTTYLQEDDFKPLSFSCSKQLTVVNTETTENSLNTTYQYENFKITTLVQKGSIPLFNSDPSIQLEEKGIVKISGFDFTHSQIILNNENMSISYDFYTLEKNGYTYMLGIQMPPNSSQNDILTLLSYFTLS